MTKHETRIVNVLKAKIENNEHLIKMYRNNPEKWSRCQELNAECRALQDAIYCITDTDHLERKEAIFLDDVDTF